VKRVVLELTSGLGNQLIQWATAYELAAALREQGEPCRIELDTRKLWRPSSRGFALARVGLHEHADALISPTVARRAFWSACSSMPARFYTAAHNRIGIKSPNGTLKEVHSGPKAIEALSSGSPGVWLRGYLQDPSFFFERRDEIRTVFNYFWKRVQRETTVDGSRRDHPADYAALHVRRGDFLTHAHIGTCELGYFAAADAHIDPDLDRLIVSDDPDWCRLNLLPELRSGARVVETGGDLGDFEVLQRARQIVISNSTFSWWAAFTGRPDVVVAPTPWLASPDGNVRLPGSLPSLLVSRGGLGLSDQGCN